MPNFSLNKLLILQTIEPFKVIKNSSKLLMNGVYHSVLRILIRKPFNFFLVGVTPYPWVVITVNEKNY